MYNFPWVKEFLHFWSLKQATKTVPSSIVESERQFNRICSDKDSLSGPILTKYDEAFREVIEPGVKDLVFILTQKFWLVTIWSCEGHRHLSTTHSLSKRFVKIIWRNNIERQQFYSRINEAIRLTNSHSEIVKVMINDFEEEFPDGNKYHLCFLIFISFNNSVDEYFQNIDSIYNQFIKELANV